jgi:hypothetical protein
MAPTVIDAVWDELPAALEPEADEELLPQPVRASAARVSRGTAAVVYVRRDRVIVASLSCQISWVDRGI